MVSVEWLRFPYASLIGRGGVIYVGGMFSWGEILPCRGVVWRHSALITIHNTSSPLGYRGVNYDNSRSQGSW